MTHNLESIAIDIYHNCNNEPYDYAVRLHRLQTACRLLKLLDRHKRGRTAAQDNRLRQILLASLQSRHQFEDWLNRSGSDLAKVAVLLLSAGIDVPNRDMHLVIEIMCLADISFQNTVQSLSQQTLNNLNIRTISREFGKTQLAKDLAAELQRSRSLEEHLRQFLQQAM